MIPRCTDCELFVRRDAPVCFNCGIPNPAEETFVRKESKHTFSFTMVGTLLFAIVITSVAAIVTYLEKPENLWQNIGCSFAMSLILGFIFSIMATTYIESKLAKAAWKQSRHAETRDSLVRRENEALERISELVDEETDIESLRNPDYDRTDAAAASEEVRLFGLLSLVALETLLYNLRIDEIKLLRLKSDLVHLGDNLNSLGADETEECLEIVEQAIADMEQVADPEEYLGTDLAEPDESGAGECTDDTGPEADVYLLEVDHSELRQRVDELQRSFKKKSDRILEMYRETRDSLFWRFKAFDQGLTPTAAAAASLIDAHRSAPENLIRDYDALAQEHDGLLAELRREFDALNEPGPVTTDVEK